MKPSKQTNEGFTLVELMVVMVVMSIMGGMIMVAVQGVTESARSSRTRTIIELLDGIIQEKYDSYKYRTLPVEIPAATYASNVGTTNGDGDVMLSFEVLGTEAARVRLNMIRDLQRMEMPDRYSDFQTGPASIWGAANPVLAKQSTEQIVATRADKTTRRPFSMSWYTSVGGAVPSLVQSYQQRVTGTATDEYQSAECLYLIISTSYAGGTPAIDAIPTSNIGDIDGDGMFEIHDGWGYPIGFIRWPVGYQDSAGVLDVSNPDEFDLFRSDLYYTVATPPAPSSATVLPAVDVNTGTVNAPWALKPLIISPGEDGVFGIAFDPIDNSGSALAAYDYTHSDWAWPKDAANMGVEHQGRGSADYDWVDPYCRRFIADNDPGIRNRGSGSYAADTERRLPGEELTGGENEALADNITNFSLQVAQ